MFKRKLIEFFPPPETPEDLDTEVWFIPETKEWFTDYDDYLTRLDYYNTRKFVCECTGITGFTFWEALEIETREIGKVHQFFPEACKEPILRYVQFSMVQRIDVLIDEIYYKFKSDFFPGDQVNVKMSGTPLKEKGVVKEKLRFNAITLPNGEQRKLYCQYRVLLISGDQEITCDETDLSRDRMAFTKQFIRGFVKLTLIKSPRPGSPWVVKDSYAKKFRISQEYPPHLLIFKQDLDSVPLRKRPREDIHVNLQPLYPLPQVKKRKDDEEDNELMLKIFPFAFVTESQPSADPLETSMWKQSWFKIFGNMTVFIDEHSLKPTDKTIEDNVILLFTAVGANIIFKFDPVSTNLILTKRTYSPKFNYNSTDFFYEMNHLQRRSWNFEKVLRFFRSLGLTVTEQNQITAPNFVVDPDHKLRPLSSFESQVLSQPMSNKQQDLLPLLPKGATPMDQMKLFQKLQRNSRGSSPMMANPKKPIVIDDLSLPFQFVEGSARPQWKSLEADEIHNISELLESWCFLNIYKGALLLDNFTLDDYITLVTWRKEDLECPLLEEIFCATMKCVLNDEVKIGGNNTHGISKDENGVGDGEQYLILIPRKGGYVVDKTPSTEDDDIKMEEVKEESEEPTSEIKSEENGVKEEENDENEDVKSEDRDDEEDDEDEEDEEDEETNNVHKFMFFKKRTWQDRLRKRQFTDGQWLIILLGIFSLVEHVPRYESQISEIFEYMAPADMPATTATLQSQFYNELPVDCRINAITILCELLTSGVVIRNFIDKSLEDATQLRKERIEVVREYKSFMDQASVINKECIEMTSKNKHLLKVEIKPLDPKDLKMKQRGGRPPALKDKPTDEELALLKINKDFNKILRERIGYLDKLNEAKAKKKEIEFKLNELDMQRITYVGCDRLYNRYWWFESNGLPTMKSFKKSDEDEDEDNGDESFEEEEEEDEDGLKDETYLVGRLFVQGPLDTDRRRFLDLGDDIIEKWEQEEDDEEGDEEVAENDDPESKKAKMVAKFESKCTELFGLKFENKTIKSKEDKVLVDEYGATSIDLISKVERKFIEEQPDPLLTKNDWRFIDTPQDFEKLLGYLNRLGEREGKLFKELDLLKDGIKLSMESRIKLLGLEKKSNDEIKLEERIDAIVISDVEDQDMEEEEEEEEEEAEYEEEDEVVQTVTPNSDPEDEFYDADEDEEPVVRSSRRIRGRKALNRVEKPEIRRSLRNNGHRAVEPVSLPPVVKKPKMSAVKKSKRQRIKLHQQKVAEKERLLKLLENLRNNRSEVRCLEWVNSSCIQATGKTHYEGVKENRPRGRPRK